MEIQNVPLAAIGILGVSDTFWVGNPLPLPLVVLGMPGCNLLVSLDVFPAAGPLLPDVQGKATWLTRIPNVPGFVGVGLHQQAFVLAPGANPFNALMSNAGTMTFGRK